MEGVNLQIWNSFPNTEMSPWYRLPLLRVAPASNIQVSTDHCLGNSFNLELTTDPAIKSFCADLNCWIKSDTERWLQHLPSIVELPPRPTNFYNEIADFEVKGGGGKVEGGDVVEERVRSPSYWVCSIPLFSKVKSYTFFIRSHGRNLLLAIKRKL